MQLDAPAKINLHLEVLGLRPDGFHELAMVMQTIDLADRLTLECLPQGELRLTLDSTTGAVPLGGDNLILRAAEALRLHVGRPQLGAAIHLCKRIPIGAGLAGGSSDAAAALRGLCALWQLSLATEVLEQLAASIGSDVPFCLRGGTQLCFGRGERLEPLPDLPPLGVLLLKDPGVSVATPWAYGLCRERLGADYVSDEAAFERRRQALRQRFGHDPRFQLIEGDVLALPLPPADAVVDYGDRAEHCWNGDPTRPNAYSRLRYPQMVLPWAVERMLMTAPAGADTRSWRY